MTRIIYFKRLIPIEDECIWITNDENFDIDEYLGEDIEVLSDDTYPFNINPDIPLNHVLIVE